MGGLSILAWGMISISFIWEAFRGEVIKEEKEGKGKKKGEKAKGVKNRCIWWSKKGDGKQNKPICRKDFGKLFKFGMGRLSKSTFHSICEISLLM